MNLVSLLIAPAIVQLSIGADENAALRITIAVLAAAVIAVAIYVTKQRPISIGEDEPAATATV
jgi:K(+)-stimulated pyrophosphate-energized sodium pump